MKIAALLCAVLLAALSVCARPKDIRPPKGFAKTVYDATLAVYVVDEDGTANFDCSATVFEKTSDGYNLISAGHCIDGVPARMGFAATAEINGPLMPVTIVRARLSGTLDFAVFHLQTKKSFPVIPLGNENDSRVGDKTLNANFTFALGKQYAPGFIASQTLPVTVDCEQCWGRFMDHMLASEGASGSAVISDRTHKIIGVVVADFNKQVGIAVEDISAYAQFLALPDEQVQLHAEKPPDISIFFQ